MWGEAVRAAAEFEAAYDAVKAMLADPDPFPIGAAADLIARCETTGDVEAILTLRSWATKELPPLP